MGEKNSFVRTWTWAQKGSKDKSVVCASSAVIRGVESYEREKKSDMFLFSNLYSLLQT